MYWQYIDLLRFRAFAELRRDSSNMYLGMLWWLLEPIIYMLVFYLIFGVGLKKGGTDFALYLLCGLVPWKWMDSTVRTSSGVIYSSAGLMRQVYFPKWLLPGYVILANTYKFFIVFFLLILFLWASGVKPSYSWVVIPWIIFVQLLFVSALSLLSAAVVPLIPDLKFVINYGMTMLFFVSGIFFNVSEMSEPVRTWLMWIPSVLLIDSYRAALLYGYFPEFEVLLLVIFQAFVIGVCGLCLLVGLDRYYPRLVG